MLQRLVRNAKKETYMENLTIGKTKPASKWKAQKKFNKIAFKSKTNAFIV